MRTALAGLGLILSLSACEGGGDPVEQALRDASAANHAATVRDGVISRPAPGGAREDSADAVYVASMITHHREAIAAADTILAGSQDPEIRRLARSSKVSRTREIAELRAWTPAAQTAP